MELRTRRVSEKGDVRAGPYVRTADYGPLGAHPDWLEPALFERLCDEDPAVQGALRQAAKKEYSAAAILKVREQIATVFEEQYLVYLVQQFDKHAELMAQYFAAKLAWRRLQPADTSAGNT